MKIVNQLGFRPTIKVSPSRHAAAESSLNPNAYFGIELELEEGNMEMLQNNLKAQPYAYWQETVDDSLRNGVELIFHTGLRTRWAQAAISNIPDILKETNFSPSWRCGVHIHNYVGEFTLHQLQAYLMIYLINESAIYSLSEHSRISSNFCTPLLHVNHSELEALLLSENLEDWRYHADRRYLGFNPVPLWDKGTIEFRSFESTTSPKKLLEYVSAINEIYTIAEKIPFSEIAIDILEGKEKKYAVTKHPMDEAGIQLVRDILISNS